MNGLVVYPRFRPVSWRLVFLLLFLATAFCLSQWADPACAAAKADGTGADGNTSSPQGQLIARGKYLVDAGDCRACHTRQGGKPFAGGLPIKTDFGTVYSPNITPDSDTGIGSWSDEDFYVAMHDGRGPDGHPLYPVFPYTYFSKVTKKDVLAIKAYLFSLKPVHYQRPAAKMSWPYNIRPLLYFWQMLFLDKGAFQPDSKRSPAYNRGAYLVKGLGHCGACHTPRNWLGAVEHDKALKGAHMDGWYAPDISSDAKSTVRDMTTGDIVDFLKTGASNPSESGAGPETAALGPMAEVVHKSLSHLSDKDLKDIAIYLRGPQADAGQASSSATAATEGATTGEKIYKGNCSACHGADGDGTPPYFPALSGNNVVDLSNPIDVVKTVLNGAPQDPSQRYSPNATMPAFGGQLSDKEVAAVTTYIRTHWQNNASRVTKKDVAALR